MGSSILMGVFSNADLQLQDEWKVNLCTVDSSLSEKRYENTTPVVLDIQHVTILLSYLADFHKVQFHISHI